jgi:predicted dehydrogenase
MPLPPPSNYAAPARVDAVFVATPNICHLENTLAALDADKPVLCDKPMAINAAECRAMIDAGRSNAAGAHKSHA